LESGRLAQDGTTDQAIARYYHRGGSKGFDGQGLDKRPRQYGTGEVRFQSIEVVTGSEVSSSFLFSGDPIRFCVTFEVKQQVKNVFFDLILTDLDGKPVGQARFPYHSQEGLTLNVGVQKREVTLNSVIFPGAYSTILGVSLMSGLTIDWVEKAIEFDVLNAPSNSIHHHAWAPRGYFRCEAEWTEA
jgi:hypothetical protein